jgi:mRNA interferase RelE/StbE
VRASFRKSFLRDLKKVGDRRVLAQVEGAILAVEAAGGLGDLSEIKKMSGGEGYYRLRVGDYRLGLAVEGDSVAFVRVLHRKEIYRHFP